jgi:hypothetical protein
MNDSISDWPSACEWPTTPKTKPSETVVQRRKNKSNIMSENLQLGQALGQRQVDKVHPGQEALQLPFRFPLVR